MHDHLNLSFWIFARAQRMASLHQHKRGSGGLQSLAPEQQDLQGLSSEKLQVLPARS